MMISLYGTSFSAHQRGSRQSLRFHVPLCSARAPSVCILFLVHFSSTLMLDTNPEGAKRVAKSRQNINASHHLTEWLSSQSGSLLIIIIMLKIGNGDDECRQTASAEDAAAANDKHLIEHLIGCVLVQTHSTSTFSNQHQQQIGLISGALNRQTAWKFYSRSLKRLPCQTHTHTLWQSTAAVKQ